MSTFLVLSPQRSRFTKEGVLGYLSLPGFVWLLHLTVGGRGVRETRGMGDICVVRAGLLERLLWSVIAYPRK